ncbi:Soluble lytic murein transglycosylase-like protein [Hyella patelloides LEGE 07179]|uniref:Soluble lytic murein transglycosylase-like protein n=1 Tax=Hyella patelloides LEGE 07179 TaxID=945734 RepID=A0A563W271_9CYAN|nr:transglycosylase SLT domain-containing protein [Hyella patelloides]VEP17735.1 Soluble lytic murein transglycosylase-like protein [Hyella patelloides LEGE 07179]
MLEQEPSTKGIEEQESSSLKRKNFLIGLTGGLISILVLSGLFYLVLGSKWQTKKASQEKTLSLEDSVITNLSDRSKAQRLSQLSQLLSSEKSAKNSEISQLDRHRARYLLAVESLKRNQPQAALQYLEGLATDYELLAPYILLREAEAYQKMQQSERASTITESILTNYPDSPAVVELLTLLNRRSSEDISYLVSQFPYHPQTQQIAKEKIKQNRDHWQSLLLMATYDRGENLNQIRDRLVLEYPAQLTKQDWQTIADGYWRSGEHRKAADAYLFSPPSPQNLYRTARGFHRNGNFTTAKRAYQRLIREYHDAQETGQALLYIARLSSADEAIAYLDIAIAKFPIQIPQALLDKATIYDRFDKIPKAQLSRKQALENYPDSQAVLNYRWQKAYNLALRGDYNGAWQWGKAIANTKSKESDPKAIFWLGKWANQAGKTEGANLAFKTVLKLHPQSYYAWRSAVMLGQDVGDFQNLRQIQPNLKFKQHYEPLPIGSETLQELYLLGQYQDAWVHLQSELFNPQQLTVEEQFTEGLLLVKLGQIRPGIQHIWNLAQRESVSDRAKWRSLRERDTYWYSLFPFPYQESIVTHARQEKINPLLPISVMRKESTFDPQIDSPVGAVGLMQVIPRTADWIAEQNNIATYNLTKPEDNIQMGTWYLAHNHQRYQNNSLYAIASYNAGTGNVNSWLQQFSLQDPDLFVEQIPFPETKDYVEGVFGNYWNYLRLYDSNYQL